jgi:hypothetical protein
LEAQTLDAAQYVKDKKPDRKLDGRTMTDSFGYEESGRYTNTSDRQGRPVLNCPQQWWCAHLT